MKKRPSVGRRAWSILDNIHHWGGAQTLCEIAEPLLTHWNFEDKQQACALLLSAKCRCLDYKMSSSSFTKSMFWSIFHLLNGHSINGMIFLSPVLFLNVIFCATLCAKSTRWGWRWIWGYLMRLMVKSKFTPQMKPSTPVHCQGTTGGFHAT